MSKKKTNPEVTPEEVKVEEVKVETQIVEEHSSELDAILRKAAVDKAILAAHQREAEKIEEERMAVKDFFVMVGKAIRTYFVNLGIRIRDFFVNCWRGIRRFFHNVAIFFKMLFSLRKKPQKEVAVEEETAEQEQIEVVTEEMPLVAEENDENAESEQVEVVDEAQEIEAMKSRFKHFFRKRNKDIITKYQRKN